MKSSVWPKFVAEKPISSSDLREKYIVLERNGIQENCILVLSLNIN